MKQENTCQTCGVGFAGLAKRNYCSRSCWPSQKNRSRITVACTWCGKTCQREISRGHDPVCSGACQVALMMFKSGRAQNAWPRTVKCRTCDSRVTVLSGRRNVRCEVCRPEPRAAQAPKARVARFVAGECWECGESFVGDRSASFSIQPGHTFCSPKCKSRASGRRRRAREVGAAGSFRWIEVIRLFIAFDRTCAYCQSAIDGQPDPDHVLPLSRGGVNDISNILPCCSPCNSDKRELTLDEWADDRKRRGKRPVRTRSDRPGPPWSHLYIRQPQEAALSHRAA